MAEKTGEQAERIARWQEKDLPPAWTERSERESSSRRAERMREAAPRPTKVREAVAEDIGSAFA